jgi:hypothetical protein
MSVDPTRLRSAAPFLVGATTLATVLAAACSTSAPTRTDAFASPTASTAGPSPAPGQLGVAAYTAMWADVQAVGLTSNYQDPRLADHVQGKPLATFRENIALDQAHGVVGHGAPVLHPSVITATATTVTLRDCLDDSGWIKVYAATGRPIDSIPGGHRYVAATVTDENGTWKVTSLDVHAEGTC